MELLIGCGHSREKRLRGGDIPEDWVDLITLDVDANVNPNVVHNLESLPYPFPNDKFDEVHAYEILEHTGQQGDFRFFFDQFTELHRILKPGGFLVGSCPCWDAEWAWADPGHKRILTPKTLMFLSQDTYKDAGKPGNALADYRFCYKADFELYHQGEPEGSPGQWYFILRAKK